MSTSIVVVHFDVLHDGRVIFPVEGRGAGHQHEQNDSQRPDIAFLAVRLGQYLRRYVVGSAHDFSFLFLCHFCLHVLLPFEGQSEVDEHKFPGVVVDHHKVLEL